MDDDFSLYLEGLNFGFSLCFMLEMALKASGFSCGCTYHNANPDIRICRYDVANLLLELPDSIKPLSFAVSWYKHKQHLSILCTSFFFFGILSVLIMLNQRRSTRAFFRLPFHAPPLAFLINNDKEALSRRAFFLSFYDRTFYLLFCFFCLVSNMFRSNSLRPFSCLQARACTTCRLFSVKNLDTDTDTDTGCNGCKDGQKQPGLLPYHDPAAAGRVRILF